MYAIYVGGDCLEYCEKPHYIKEHTDEETGRTWYVQADNYDEAIAVTVHGTIYSLPFKEPIEGHETEATIVEKDSGTYVFQNKENTDKNTEEIAVTKEDVETALCEIDMSTEERIAMLEDVICELDMLKEA